MTPINLGTIGEVGPDFARRHCRKDGPTTSEKLKKVETVALWHCVINSAYMLRALKEDGGTTEQIAHETQILINAKRALRKVNAIRKAQS